MQFPEALPIGWEVMEDHGSLRLYGRSDGLLVTLEHTTSSVCPHGKSSTQKETVWRLRTKREHNPVSIDELQMIRELFFGKERAVFAFSTAAEKDPGDWVFTLFHVSPDPLDILDTLESMTSQF